MWLTIAFLSVLLYLLYKYYDGKYRYWKDRGVPTPPYIWTFETLLLRFRESALAEVDHVKKYGKIYGTYFLTAPVLVVADYELSKKILIKDFQHFNTRIKFPTYHKMWNENLALAGFERWRRVRTIASPAFTSGKLRAMNPLIQNCVDKLIVYLDKVVADDKGIIKMTKETLGGFTMDAIASAVFATETNSNDLREKPNPIVIYAQRIFIVQKMKALFAWLAPEFMLKLFKIDNILDSEAFNFYIDFVRHIIKQRRESKIFRNDLIQFLLDAEVDEKELEMLDSDRLTASDVNNNSEENAELKSLKNIKKLTEDEIIAQALIFLTAGYETTATTLTHAIHELSLNPSIQDSLYEEAKEVLSDLDPNTEEYYERIMNNTPYLEATIKETLRKYPSISRLYRLCNTDGYQLGDLTLKAGQQIEISVVAIQRNPDLYPEPEAFLPERFLSADTKGLASLSWGLGPRLCIGMRFATQEMKSCLAKLILRYKFQKPDGVTDPKLVYRKGTPLLICDDFQTEILLR